MLSVSLLFVIWSLTLRSYFVGASSDLQLYLQYNYGTNLFEKRYSTYYLDEEHVYRVMKLGTAMMINPGLISRFMDI